MDLEAFRKRIREFCRPTGYSQKMLAYELGLQPTALSNKLNGTGETSLKQSEVKQIIKILAQWDAITTQLEAVELLELMNLKQNSFAIEEWNTLPLNKLLVEEVVQKADLDRHPPQINAKIEPARVSSEGAYSLEGTYALSDHFTDQIETPPHNLPVQPTPLIGREQEIEEALSLLRRADVQLLTLTGSGGVGKTRLALRLATELLADFESGVFFVSLASISDPNLVLSTIAHTLGIRESGSQTVAGLITSYLRDKRLLLVLDNFEQVLAASVVVKELMGELPYLKVLITSRALLHLYGEYEYVVPSLTLPDPTLLQAEISPDRLEELASYEAIALFIQRARAAKPGFKLSSHNILTVVEICQRLDGLPLAIELAAARIKIMAPSLILARMSHRLELLSRGPHDLPARQQTLRALIDWSYDLLDASEKKLLTRLAVFAGGCDLEAVEAVGWDQQDRATIAAIASPELGLDKLTDLVDKSMLQPVQTENGEPRFRMLETLREYFLEKLRASGEEQAIYERHTLYFLKLAELGEVALVGSEQKAWLDRLETEHDNFRAALAWAIAKMNLANAEKNIAPATLEINLDPKATEESQSLLPVELGLRLSSLLARFWDMHGHLSEGRRWLDQVLMRGNDYGAGGTEVKSQVPNPQIKAKALNAAGNLARKQADTVQAVALLEEALTLRRELGQPLEISQTLNNLGAVLYHDGDYERALKFYEESLAIKQKLGDKRSLALSLNNLGELHRTLKNDQKALDLFDESLTLLREVGDIFNIALVLLNLGVTTYDQGNYRRASTLLTESLELLGELGDKLHIAEALERLATLATELANVALAARLFGSAQALRLSIAAPIGENYRALYEQTLQLAQTQLDPAVWVECWAAGQQMTLEESIDYALAEFSSQVIPNKVNSSELVAITKGSTQIQPNTSQPQITTYPAGLTQREVEVLRLVATGLTTAQIAENLTLSPLTIQAHLRSIYSKLEINSRSAATRYALENGLL